MDKPAALPRIVGPLTIDPLARKLYGPLGEASVQPLVMQLLLMFVENIGEVVPRRDLFAALWGNAQVGDDSLNRLVLKLRQTLDECAGTRLTVETIPRTGYRLRVALPDRATPPVSRRMLVVGGGLAAFVVAGLLSRADYGSDEGSRWIDEGDVRLRDSVPAQAGIAIAPLRKALAIEPRNARALGLLALAQETSANNGGSRDAGALLRDAEQSAKAALAIDPAEAHARLALLDMSGAQLDWLEWERQLEQVLARAPANVHVLNSLSSFLQAAGQTGRSWEINERAAAAAPSSPTPQWRKVLRLWTGGEDEAALQLSARLIRLWPNHALVWNARFMVLAFTGRMAAARDFMAAPNPVLNNHPARSAQWGPTFAAMADPSPAHVEEARRANLAAAQADPGQAAYAAMALSQLGELDAALAVMDAVLLARGPLVTHSRPDPGSFLVNSPSWCRTQWLFMPPLKAVRATPRFRSICEEIGLAAYWRAHGGGPELRLPSGSRS